MSVHNVCVLQVLTEYRMSQSEAAEYNQYIAMIALQLLKTSLGMHHQTTTTFNTISSSTRCKASPPAVRAGPAAMQHKPHLCFECLGGKHPPTVCGRLQCLRQDRGSSVTEWTSTTQVCPHELSAHVHTHSTCSADISPTLPLASM